jgi:two-component system chemotaxis response regulator CheY
VKSLIAEDDLTSRFLLQQILQPFGMVHVVANGQEAVKAVHDALASGQMYDLICLDIMMPEMDGVSALKAIREEETRLAALTFQMAGLRAQAHCRILMTTAVNARETVQAAVEAQCDGYLLKPYQPSAIRQQLREFGLIF